MGRPRLADMLDAKKFSVNISPDNQEAIDLETINMSMKYGPFINLLIKTFCRMSPKMRTAFINFCISQCKEINNLMRVSGAFERIELEKEKKSYLEIAQIINDGVPVNFDNNDPTLQKIPVKNGVLIIPSNWIILNPEAAQDCIYAGVIECRNGSKYGIPHFCFFSNTKPRDYSDSFIRHLKELCCEKWPEFTDVLKNEVKLIPDPKKPGSYLNEKEYLASPIIGFFPLPSTDDPHFDYDPPYGAMIVRNSSEENV